MLDQEPLCGSQRQTPGRVGAGLQQTTKQPEAAGLYKQGPAAYFFVMRGLLPSRRDLPHMVYKRAR